MPIPNPMAMEGSGALWSLGDCGGDDVCAGPSSGVVEDE